MSDNLERQAAKDINRLSIHSICHLTSKSFNEGFSYILDISENIFSQCITRLDKSFALSLMNTRRKSPQANQNAIPSYAK